VADLELLKRTVRRNRERLRNIQPGHVERLLALSREAQAEITERMRGLDPTRFSSARAGVFLAQINDGIDELGRQLGEQLGDAVEDLGTEAAGIAKEDLRAQLEVWVEDHPGAERAIARLDEAAEVLSPGLLEHFEVSRRRYGDQAISRMRDAMSLSLLNDETMIQTAGRLADSIGIEDWRAERIVRTEQSAAFHRQWLDEAKADSSSRPSTSGQAKTRSSSMASSGALTRSSSTTGAGAISSRRIGRTIGRL
jgi:hypothetical protein